MHRVLLLGAGKIGRMIAKLLSQTGDYDVIVGDVSEQALERIHRQSGVRDPAHRCPQPIERPAALQGRDTVISALDFRSNRRSRPRRVEAGVNYFDLTEDVETTRRVREIAARHRPGRVVMPQCGLAPGFISIVASPPDQGVRRARHGAHARRRAAAVSVQRAEVQPDLVDRRADQRVLQPVRGDPRRQRESRCCRSKGSRRSR